MVCDICKEKIATVHYTEIINNKIHKMDLCEDCAKEKNLGFNTQFSVADILKGLTDSAAVNKTTTEPVCSFCGLSYSKFKKIGRLGCGSCYEAFEGNLSTIINDVHKNTQHVGKAPGSGMKKMAKTSSRLDKLQEELRQAVTSERFEQAAEIRDAIKALQNQEESQS